MATLEQIQARMKKLQAQAEAIVAMSRRQWKVGTAGAA